MSEPTRESAILGAIMDAAVDAIIVSDRQGDIVRANPAASTLFGYEGAELIGRNVRELMPSPMSQQHDGYMSRYIRTGEKRIIGIGRQVEGLRKDGTVFPLHLSVGDATIGDERMFIGVLHDVSQRVAGEAALARSQRMDAIGQMTGGIAHDFNNILTVIIGNLELLETRVTDSRQQNLIGEALDAAEMASQLTSRLMIFARRGALKPAPADLRAVCTAALELLKRTLGSRYAIVTDFAQPVPRVLIDPVQMQTALVNLALNARDAMPDGGDLRFAIREVRIDDDYMAQEIDVSPGTYVRLTVSDTGEGMSAEVQKKAFEPFFSTKPESHGTGLGLAMVYGFVRQSGGHVTLYSEPGHGSTFGLYFPALPEDDRAAALSDAPAPPPLEAPPEAPRILVVEDNPNVLRLSCERLQALGYATLSASDASEASALLEAGAEVDLLFSDVIMPGKMNGYDLAAKVARDFPAVKILLTSGYARDAVPRADTQAAAFELLQKPYRQRDLAARLHALLGDASD